MPDGQLRRKFVSVLDSRQWRRARGDFSRLALGVCLMMQPTGASDRPRETRGCVLPAAANRVTAAPVAAVMQSADPNDGKTTLSLHNEIDLAILAFTVLLLPSVL